MAGSEVMTDFQFKSILKMLLAILDSSATLAEAKEKIEQMLEDGK